MKIDSSIPIVLFLSVDVVGSTSFKTTYEAINKSGHWISAFETFFTELPLVFLGQLAFATEDQESVANVWVWKVIGDEIILAAYPNGVEEALAIVLAFYRTVIQFDAKFSTKWPLRIRGCCWGARLDIRNRRILIPEIQSNTNDQTCNDFLGPDVDIGFRLSGCVGRGQVIISSNLAESLIKFSNLHGLCFYLIGRRVLKGVYGGRPYPLILISTEDNPPDFWEWEPDEDKGLAYLRDHKPTSPSILIAQLEKIREHLMKMHKINVGPALFEIIAD